MTIFARQSDIDAVTACGQTTAGALFESLGTTHALLVAAFHVDVLPSSLQRPVRRSTSLVQCPSTATATVREALAADKTQAL